nr:spore coat associated protein CotJA [Clostridium sp. C2-6-12]
MYKHDECMCKAHENSMDESKEMPICKMKEDCMHEHMHDHMHKSMEYARAYILPQKYENLYSCKEGFLKGTIFVDLYRPYHECKKCKY